MYLEKLEELIIYRPSSASQGSISTGEIDAIHRSILNYNIGEENKSTFHVFYDQTAYIREVNLETGRFAFVKRKLVWLSVSCVIFSYTYPFCRAHPQWLRNMIIISCYIRRQMNSWAKLHYCLESLQWSLCSCLNPQEPSSITVDLEMCIAARNKAFVS